MIFIGVYFSACSVNQLKKEPVKKEVTQFKKVEEKKEVIKVYKREAVTPQLQARVNEIVAAILKNDITELNTKYINKDFGFYNVFKIDGVTVFTKQEEVLNIINDKADELSDLIKYASQESIENILNLETTKFDCSPKTDEFYGWNKEGIFLNSEIDTKILTLMNEENKFQVNKHSKEELEKAEFIEKTSYKVLVTPYLVFYVSKIEDNWYISLFDRISTDCSTQKDK